MWRVIGGLLGAALVAVWHVALLWRLRETPGWFAALLVAVFVLVVAARAVARAEGFGSSG